MKNFFSDKRGNFAVSLACLATLLLGGVGGAVDLIVYNNHHSQLQDTADAAVLAAAHEAALKGWSLESAKETVAAIVESNLQSRYSDTTSFDQKIEVNEKGRRISLELTQDHFGYFFLGYFTGSPQISVHSIASASGQSNICIIVESEGEDNAFELSGDAYVNATDCSAYSNSSSAKGISARDNASLLANLACSVGGYSGALRNYKPLPLTDCPQIGDPLAARAAVIDASVDSDTCSFTKLDIKTTTKTLSPGTYCGDLNIHDNATVLLKPGIYVIKNGKFKVDKKSSITGKNVGFVFSGAEAGMEFKHDTTISLTAPETGPLAGILMYAPATDAKKGPGRMFKIESEDAQDLIGTVYLPGDQLEIGGDKDANGVCDSDEGYSGQAAGGSSSAGTDCNSAIGSASAWTAIVVRKLRVTAGARLVLNADYSATTIPVPAGIGPTSANILLAR